MVFMPPKTAGFSLTGSILHFLRNCVKGIWGKNVSCYISGLQVIYCYSWRGFNTPLLALNLTHKICRNNPSGAASGGGKKLEESAYGATSGITACIRAFTNNKDQRNLHIQCAGRRYCTLVLAFTRSSPPAGNSRNFLPPPLAAPLGFIRLKPIQFCL